MVTISYRILDDLVSNPELKSWLKMWWLRSCRDYIPRLARDACYHVFYSASKSRDWSKLKDTNLVALALCSFHVVFVNIWYLIFDIWYFTNGEIGENKSVNITSAKRFNEENRQIKMDVRYNFLNTLDHYPCELIRTLWILQSLDIERSRPETTRERDEWLAMHMSTQSVLLENLTDERIKALNAHREHLIDLQRTRKRCEVVRRRQRQPTNSGKIAKSPKLTIKLNLSLGKKDEGSYVNQTSRVHNIQSVEEEPQDLYCFCNKPSFGAMIACDNPNCPKEWFHYGCVGITKPPTGKWYCTERCKRMNRKLKRWKKMIS